MRFLRAAARRCAVICSAMLIVAARPVRTSEVDRWNDPVAEASARFGVPVEWIRRVMTAESGGRTLLDGRPIRSRAGAMGLMQLMPGTWTAMRAAHRLGPDPDDPRDNILAGTAYLRAMYDRFGYPGLFGAYNAGPARYARYLAGGTRLPAETVAYVAQVAGRGPGGEPANESRESIASQAAPLPLPAPMILPRSSASPASEDRPSVFFALGRDSGR